MHWFKKIIKLLVLLELSYLILFNIALSLPLTQDLINDIRPEKFYISWQKAWTWYPFRVHIRDGFANGQSRNQQWQFSAERVSASISLLPLIYKRVSINDVVGIDIDYRQRPRLSAARKFGESLPFFPEIEGWEITEADTGPLPDRRPWHISIDDISVSGNHRVWISQFKARFNADINGDLKVRTRSGPFSLDIHSLDMALQPLYMNGSQEVLHRGSLRGSMGFSEFVPKKTKNFAILNFLRLDLEVSTDSESLAFLNIFLHNFEGVNVHGHGAVDGRLRFENGEVLEGTDLTIDAGDLHVKVMMLDINGSGSVNLSRDSQKSSALEIDFGFQDLSISHRDDLSPLLVGEDMTLSIGSDARIVAGSGKRSEFRSITASVGTLDVPDLSLFQRYVPGKWPFHLHGGTGKLRGSFGIMPSSFMIDLSISSESADMGIKQFRFDTDLDFALKLDNPSIQTQSTRIAGTYLKLANAHLVRDGVESAEPFEFSVTIHKGLLTIFGNRQKQVNDTGLDLLTLIAQTDAARLLGDTRGLMGFNASVSSLGWMGVLLGKEHHVSVSGSGAVRGDLQLVAGLPAPGTDIEVISEALKVDILDYALHGDGRIGLIVEEGGAEPDWHVGIELSDAGLMRKNESSAVIQDVTIKLDTLVRDVSFEETENPYILDFKILSARVLDMSVFNRYFPPDAPFSFVAGSADLSADIQLQPEKANGWVKLDSRQLEFQLDNQLIGADLLVDIKLHDGVPANMEFDISGSKLQLTRAWVIGEEQQFNEEKWSATLELQHGETTWQTPLKIDLEAGLLMSDSRPLVAMFRNEDGSRWLSKRLTVEDITGDIKLSMSDERLVIPYAYSESNNIVIGAKGIIAKPANNGVFYLKYKKLSPIILKVNNGKRHLDIFYARKKFDEYEVHR